jgi:hypothetical protein
VRDGITARVLAVHIAAHGPLSFDQVVELCQGHVTRCQVRHASAALCRDGDLARIVPASTNGPAEQGTPYGPPCPGKDSWPSPSPPSHLHRRSRRQTQAPR